MSYICDTNINIKHGLRRMVFDASFLVMQVSQMLICDKFHVL